MSATRTLSRAKPIFELNVRFLVDLVGFAPKSGRVGRRASKSESDRQPKLRGHLAKKTTGRFRAGDRCATHAAGPSIEANLGPRFVAAVDAFED